MATTRSSSSPPNDTPQSTLKERRALLLLKTGRSSHALRHVWFNPHDPMFLRYAPEADFRGVKILPLDPAQVTMTWTANRTKRGVAEELIQNCHRRHRLKVVDRNRRAKSWSLYFQSLNEFESWKELLTTATGGNGASPSSTTRDASTKWWESKYASDGTRSLSRSSRQLSSVAPSSTGSFVTVRVEFPEQMGYLFLRLQPMDAKTLTIKRFKELVFEACHIAYHGKAESNNTNITHHYDPTVTSSEDEEDEHIVPGAKKPPVPPPPTPANPTSSSKYNSKQTCEVCHGRLRQIVSRQMYHQEQVLSQGPSYYVLQRVAVDAVDPTKVAWIDSFRGETAHRYPVWASPSEPPFSASLAQPGGLYRSHAESPGRDANILLGMKYRKAKPKTAEQIRADRERQKLGDRVDEYDLWLIDEEATLQSALDKVATASTGMQACVVRLKLRAVRDVPVIAFRATVDRFTRETDAKGEYTCYWLTIRSGNRLQWEIRRRYQDFADLADSLAKEESVIQWMAESEPLRQRRYVPSALAKVPPSPLPKLFPPPGRSKPNTNDENMRMRELETFVNCIVALPPMRDTPSVSLLSFLGTLSTGMNPKLEKKIGDQRVVHVHALQDLAEFGDLILFRSVNPLSSLQRRITGGDYDHVGMVLPRGDVGYCLLEATGEGVTCYQLEDRLVAYADGFCDLVALRKIKFERTKERLLALTDFANRVEGRPYHLNFSTLAGGRRGVGNTTNGTGAAAAAAADKTERTAYFCSELVAEAMKKMGLLQGVDKKVSYWLPHHFNPGGELEHMLNPSIATFDDVTIIDCKLVEIEFSALV